MKKYRIFFKDDSYTAVTANNEREALARLDKGDRNLVTKIFTYY